MLLWMESTEYKKRFMETTGRRGLQLTTRASSAEKCIIERPEVVMMVVLAN